MRYLSTTHRQWQTLIVDSHALTSMQSGHCRKDFTPDQMKQGAVDYFEQVDNISSKAIYRMHIAEVSPDRLVFDIENVNTIRRLLAPIFPLGELQSIYFIERESETVWRFYSIMRTGKNESRLINEASAVNRAVAFYRHMVGIPTGQEPPAAR